MVNQNLKDLTEAGLWNEDMKRLLIAHSGSIHPTYTQDLMHVEERENLYIHKENIKDLKSMSDTHTHTIQYG